MFRYSPPKSNIWGHSLGRMEPGRQKALFDAFLKQAVAEYAPTGGSLSFFVGPPPAFLPLKDQGLWGHVTSKDIQHFERLLGTPARDGAFYSLSAQQCELALNEIIQDSTLRRGAMLLQGTEITQWLIHHQPVETRSHVMLYSGMKPCISTFLEFQTIEEFEFIKGVLSDLEFCTLNEKHLKPVKRGLKKGSGTVGDGAA